MPLYIRYLSAVLLAGLCAAPAYAAVSLRDYVASENCAMASAVIGGWAGFACGKHLKGILQKQRRDLENRNNVGDGIRDSEIGYWLSLYRYCACDINNKIAKCISRNLRKVDTQFRRKYSSKINNLYRAQSDLNGSLRQIQKEHVVTAFRDIHNKIDALKTCADALKNAVKSEATYPSYVERKYQYLKNDINSFKQCTNCVEEHVTNSRMSMGKLEQKKDMSVSWLERFLPSTMAAVGMFAGYGLYSLIALWCNA